ncbi:hypothetical protein A0H76_2683 [Hepatospora eriocheir]|uniref:Uncharacterized protein n=1 Tax=Hepatospora eriocheir TaxID=1081669 RepID=A0A1X0QEV6_9MICR|nr:hypothetical protein HERIO_2189 [Hepatospora eriocheir]ORD98338.1 hypothetical protein A0H76_2683 [Hepatospora eriocheir]
MKNIYNRLGYFLEVLYYYVFVFVIVIFLITRMTEIKSLTARSEIEKIGMGYKTGYGKINPNVDLTPLFRHWNTRQVFILCNAVTKNNTEMIWSEIVKRDMDYEIFKPISTNYQFSIDLDDPTLGFELKATVYPYVGALRTISISRFKKNKI